MRPVVGITAYVEAARWGVWDLTATLVPHNYVAHIAKAGGHPVVLPPDADATVLDRLDALVLAGGADIDPARYGAVPEPETTGLRPERDAGEFALLARALARDVPVLGVCRGMQVLTVASGGTLHQHLPDVVGHDGHRPAPGTFGEHTVRIAPGTRLHAILGAAATVRSYHHQGVASCGAATASAHAEDGSVEAVELRAARFAVGVLWHPEAAVDPRLFEALVTAAT